VSNRRLLRELNRTSGLLQRPKHYWSGQAGNPTTQRAWAEAQKQQAKPRVRLVEKAASE
jgi:hypothetical protein